MQLQVNEQKKEYKRETETVIHLKLRVADQTVAYKRQIHTYILHMYTNMCIYMCVCIYVDMCKERDFCRVCYEF